MSTGAVEWGTAHVRVEIWDGRPQEVPDLDGTVQAVLDVTAVTVSVQGAIPDASNLFEVTLQRIGTWICRLSLQLGGNSAELQVCLWPSE